MPCATPKTEPLYQLLREDRWWTSVVRCSRGKVGNITSPSVYTVACVGLRFRSRTIGDQVVGLPNIVRGHSVPSAYRLICCYRGTRHEEPPVLLPGRGHSRIWQRKQGAGDPHRLVSRSTFSGLCVFLCICLFIYRVHLSPDCSSEIGASGVSSKFRFQSGPRSLRVETVLGSTMT